MDKIIYIAGPYRAASSDAVSANIDRARQAAMEFAKMGIPYFCPHLNSARFEMNFPSVADDFYLNMGLLMLSRCDAMFVLCNSASSIGTSSEINWWLANRRSDTIFYQSSPMWKIDMVDWIKS